MTIEVYWGSGSPYSWRVLLALEFKGVEYQSRRLEFSKGEHRGAEYLRLNPRGKVPLLRDGDLSLRESLAIMSYLDQRFPQPPLFGTTAAETGRIWSAVMEWRNYVEPLVDRIGRPVLFGNIAEKSDDIRAAAGELYAELERAEAAAAAQGWLALDAPSAADLAAYPFLAFVDRLGRRDELRSLDVGLDELARRCPALEAWSQRIRAMPGYERTYPPHWRAAPVS